MSAPAPPNGRFTDKRVAVPIMPRPATEMHAVPRSTGPRGIRPSLLSNMTLQENGAASEPIKETVPQETARFTPIGFLNRDSEEDGANPVQDPIGTRSGNVSPARPSFSTDTGPSSKWIGGHYIRVGGIKQANAQETQKVLYSQFNWEKKLLGARTVGKEAAKMYLRFDSIDHAAEASAQVSMVLSSCETDYVLFHEYAAAAEDDSPDECHFYDGQVVFLAEFVGQISQLDTADVYSELTGILVSFGTVLAIAEGDQTSSSLEFRVEFDKISVAQRALDRFKPETAHCFNGWKLTTKEMADPLKKKISQSALQQNAHLQDDVVQSPSGRTAWIKDANGQVHVQKTIQSSNMNSMAMVPYQPQQFYPMVYNEFPEDRYYGHYSERYQHVRDTYSSANISLDEIRQGRDVRTTIMLRNIPNSWGYQDLKDRLDEFVFGLYDFSYLRIDFVKHTNVGYGFLNLTRAGDIIPLHEGLFQKPWARGGKNRECVLSYATTQGIDCLIEKFRNSSVQNEAPPFNAKLWWTSFDADNSELARQSQSSSSSNTQMVKHTDSVPHFVSPDMIGTERPFPPPDNETKHKRSNDNASQCELWSGQRGRSYGRGGGRGARRGGYSNWDRGTTRQMHEDFFQGVPMPFGYVQVAPQLMMTPYYQHYNGAGNGGNHYQHHNGAGYADNYHQHQYSQYQNGGRGAPRNGYVSNDARNDARTDTRMPRSFGFENPQATQTRGGFNQRGGRIYS